MIPAAFEYQRPASIEEALAIIAAPGAKVLAGGQSLLPLLKLRLGGADTLVDIGRLPGLRGVRRLEDGRLAIGALTTYAEFSTRRHATTGCWGTRCPTSATSRSAIAGPSAGPSPTPIRPRTCRPACSRSRPSW